MNYEPDSAVGSTLRIGLCQMCAGQDVAANLETAASHVRQAAASGAVLAALPECFAFYGPESEWRGMAEYWEERISERFSRLAASLNVSILLGSVFTPADDQVRIRNTSILIGPDGRERARYAKRHLFDVRLPERTYRESDWVQAGTDCAVADLGAFRLGMSICFDVRFPDHFQALRRNDASVMLVPSAFTRKTGQAHWEPLLRARAIETQSYVVAVGMCGTCPPDKPCYGHSMIVDPWGQILLEMGEQPGVGIADLSLGEVERVRSIVPMNGSTPAID